MIRLDHMPEEFKQQGEANLNGVEAQKTEAGASECLQRQQVKKHTLRN